MKHKHSIQRRGTLQDLFRLLYSVPYTTLPFPTPHCKGPSLKLLTKSPKHTDNTHHARRLSTSGSRYSPLRYLQNHSLFSQLQPLHKPKHLNFWASHPHNGPETLCMTTGVTPSRRAPCCHSCPHALIPDLTPSLDASLLHSGPHTITTGLTPGLQASHPQYGPHYLTLGLTPSLQASCRHSGPVIFTPGITPSLSASHPHSFS